ncbi:hypothetical protein INR49_031187, partial [Caranx melampygus]
VLIRVHACGVNPVETYIRAGTYARKPTLPYTPGSDVAGVVETVGEEVVAVKAGDRVFTTATESGGYAEFAVATEDCVYKLPDALHFTQGAAIGIPYFTAYRALVHKAHSKAGETVLIHGASGGVFGTAGTPAGMNLILNNGAQNAFNHREEGYIDKIMEATDNRGIDVIVEMLSNVNLSKDLQMLAYGGRCWLPRPHRDQPKGHHGKESSIIGVALFFATQEEKKECAALLYAGMEAGWLRPVVGCQYPLEKAAQAHQDIIESPGAAGKIVLNM